MTHIAPPGAGIGGLPLAFAMRSTLRKHTRSAVVSNAPGFHRAPSDARVAADWCGRDKSVGIGELESP